MGDDGLHERSKTPCARALYAMISLLGRVGGYKLRA